MPPSSLPPPPGLDTVSKTALFTDFDGTLVDIAARPDEVRVAPDLPGLLTRLGERLDGRLAIVTGRSLADLDAYLGIPGIAMAGSHGGELRMAGEAHIGSLAAPVPETVLQGLEAMSERFGGLLVEHKPSGGAIHFRERPALESDVLAAAKALADETGTRIKRGKMVVELVMPGADKGSAVAHLLARPEFSGARPVFVGDDVTDEDAFRVVLEHGGDAILVGEERETAAQFRLRDVAAVHEWMETALR